jgi:ATP-binding cassette subfamily C protein
MPSIRLQPYVDRWSQSAGSFATMIKGAASGAGSKPMAAAIRACREHLVQAAIFSALLNLLYLVPSIYMLQVYDRVVPTRGLTTLTMLTMIFVFAIATVAGLDYLRSRLLVRASARLDRLLSASIMSALMRTGAQTPKSSAALRDFDQFRQTITGVGVLALFDAPWAPIYVLVCFMLHPSLGALAILGAGVLLFFSWRNEKATHLPLKEANKAATMAYTGIEGSIGAAGVVKALGMRDALITRHLHERELSLSIQSRASFDSAFYMSTIKGLRLLLQSLALGLGAWLAVEQQISGGAIFAASLLVSRALAPIELVMGAWKSIIQARNAHDTLVELFDEAGPTPVTTQLPDPKGRIDVEHVQVASPAMDRLILNDISFQLEAGEVLGVVGPSGAGKSTLVRAIVGATPTHRGAIRLDGASIADWPEQQLTRAIGYVPQEASLFRGSIKDNIARFQTELAADPAAVDAEVVRAAMMCGAHEFILNLPQAYETQLGWGGSGLSVGQSQRIALARALYGRPKVLVLDEPNANLDARGEAHLMQALAKAAEEGTTVIIVAHRTGMLANVNKLLVMRDGRVQLFGTKEEVAQRLAKLSAPASPPAPATTIAA